MRWGARGLPDPFVLGNFRTGEDFGIGSSTLRFTEEEAPPKRDKKGPNFHCLPQGSGMLGDEKGEGQFCLESSLWFSLGPGAFGPVILGFRCCHHFKTSRVPYRSVWSGQERWKVGIHLVPTVPADASSPFVQPSETLGSKFCSFTPLEQIRRP